MNQSKLLAALGGVSLLLAGCGKESPPAVSNKPAAPSAPPALLSWQFAGVAALRKDGDLKTLNSVMADARSKPLFDLFARKLAMSVFSTGATNHAAVEKAAPLVADLAENPSAFVLRSGGQWTLAMKADAPTGARWSTNLWQAQSALGFQPAAAPGGAWSVKAQGSLPGFAFNLAGDTLFVSVGLPADTQALAASLAHPAPEWLKMEADSAVLQWLGPVPAGRLELAALTKGDNVKWDATLTLNQPVATPPGTPRIPQHTARDPLSGFTLVRGGWKGFEPLFKLVGIAEVPAEFSVWAEDSTPFAFSLAFPSPDPKAYVAAFATNVVPAANSKVGKTASGKIIYRETENRVIWSDVLPTVPFLTVGTNKDSGFVVGGLFPTTSTPRTKPMPDDLASQMTGRTNLVYYDWEITQLRLAQLRPTHQFVSILRGVPFNEKNSVSATWLEAVQPQLGNAITEGTQVAPNKLHFARKSHIGLGSYELLALANWLDVPKPRVRTPRPNPAAPKK